MAAQIIGLATIYETTPLHLLTPDALDQLTPHKQDLLIHYHAALPAAPQPTTAAISRPDSLERGDLVEAQDMALRLLEGRQRPTDTRELHLLARIASGILVEASNDLGDRHTGMTQARAAHACADNAGHDGLRAWARGLQPQTAYWGGWPHEALRYAQPGADAAEGVASTVAVWLPALAARAHAVLGKGTSHRQPSSGRGTPGTTPPQTSLTSSAAS